jgi:hypothetical protein
MGVCEMSTEISNTDDVIDSRDVIARIAEIEGEAQGRYMEAHPEGVSWGELEDLDPITVLDVEDANELAVLKALADEADGAGDWEYGVTLIRDSYFVDYARELAEDIGAINSDAGWPLYCIDWEWAARELRMDYFSVDFDGIDYWVRS